MSYFYTDSSREKDSHALPDQIVSVAQAKHDRRAKAGAR